MSAVVLPGGAVDECRGRRTAFERLNRRLRGHLSAPHELWVLSWVLFVLLGTAALNSAAAAPLLPVVSGFSPNSGPVGTLVIINGSNLLNVSAISFNGVNAPVFGSAADGSAVQTQVPTNAITGPVTVSTAAGTVTSVQVFQVTSSGAPTIDSFHPTSGPPGTVVSFLGSNLEQVDAVDFNGVQANFSLLQGLTAVVPAAATTGPITVRTATGTFMTQGSFTVTSATRPAITSFSPQSGPPGTIVTIIGTRFEDLTEVTFGGVTSSAASALVDTQISATVPLGAKSGTIEVTTAAGTTSSSNAFTVTALSAPLITNVAPHAAAVGATVLISGENLNYVKSVEFNGVAAEFSMLAPNEVSVKVPTASTGPITITTEGGSFTTLESFVVIGGPPAPALLSVSAWNGPPGLLVSIVATNLGMPTSVTFNGVEAAFSSYGSNITAEIPALATSGPLEVKGIMGRATAATPFTVFTSGEVGLIASTSTGLAPLGSNVVISVLITNRSTVPINNLVLNNSFARGLARSGPLVVWTNGAPGFGDVASADVDILPPKGGPGTFVVTNGAVLCQLGSLAPADAVRCDLEVASRTPDLLNFLAVASGDIGTAHQGYGSVLTSVLVSGNVEITVRQPDPAHLQISWIDQSANLKLQTSDSPVRSAVWTDVNAVVQRTGTNRSVVLPIGTALQFFRLVQIGQ